MTHVSILWCVKNLYFTVRKDRYRLLFSFLFPTTLISDHVAASMPCTGHDLHSHNNTNLFQLQQMLQHRLFTGLWRMPHYRYHSYCQQQRCNHFDGYNICKMCCVKLVIHGESHMTRVHQVCSEADNSSSSLWSPLWSAQGSSWDEALDKCSYLNKHCYYYYLNIVYTEFWQYMYL